MKELSDTLLETKGHDIMDAQADMACKGGSTMRNGYRERGPTAPVGGIAPRIPKLRAGTYIPEGLIERHSRANRSVAESWANVVSTRKMERIARKMGIGRLSKDQVNAMRRSLDAGSRNWSPGTPGRSGFPTCSWTPPTSSTGGTAGHSTRRSLPPSASPRRGVPHARRRDHRRHRRDVGTRRCVHRGGRGRRPHLPGLPHGARRRIRTNNAQERKSWVV